jgi:acyl-CoA reductase-like NAD-dependent aldehyde dehydrogenase
MPRFESAAVRVAAACRLAHGASLKSGAACNAASRLALDASLQNQWLRTW